MRRVSGWHHAALDWSLRKPLLLDIALRLPRGADLLCL